MREPIMKPRVSVIEDDARLRTIIVSWLRNSENVSFFSEFPDAESALIALPEQAPEVVLVDINLPGLDGVEFVRRAKQLIPNSQFMMLTIYEDAKRIAAALAAGATGYLLKRAKREELLEAIIDAHEGGSPMTSSIARKVVQMFHQPALTPTHQRGQLTQREEQVLDLIGRGYVNKEIADKLQISIPTVKTYIRRIYEKLHVHSRGEAVAKYLGH